MLLGLEITEGPSAGKIFPIKAGYRLGRSRGEIIVKTDPRISSLHAIVEVDNRGALYLLDKESANGLLINEVRVKKVRLMLGVKFVAGRTSFKVVEFKGAVEEDFPPPTDERTWPDIFKEDFPKLQINPSSASVNIVPFAPLIRMLFVEGPQIDQEYLVGFGPRHFGSDTLDFEIFDPVCPPVGFTLIPTENGPQFETSYPKLVRYNNGHKDKVIVQQGDRIQLGQTVIELGFIE